MANYGHIIGQFIDINEFINSISNITADLPAEVIRDGITWFPKAKNELGLAQKLLTILSAKCSVFLGLLQIDYGKLFLNDPLRQNTI